MSHTRGPWIVDEAETGFAGVPIYQDGNKGSLIAVVADDNADEVIVLADAHLIAAAPTAPHLCELQDCPGGILHALIERLREVYGDLPSSVRRYLDEYRAAILKAEGLSNV